MTSRTTKLLLLALAVVSSDPAAGAAAHGDAVPTVLLRGAEGAAVAEGATVAVGKKGKADKESDADRKGRSSSSSDAKNVYGDPLEPCSQSGMAKTGFTRSGQCVDQKGDTGSHHICIDLRSASSNGKDFCQVTGQDDWCQEDMPCHDDETKTCPVERWCVCQWAFEGYLQKAGGCEAIQEIECKAVNIKAVEAYEEDEETHGEALRCLRERCKLEGRDGENGRVAAAVE